MLLDANSFLSYGFRVTSEDDDFITRAIEDTEMFFVKNVIGDSAYTALHNALIGTPEYEALAGNATTAGMRKAIGHLAVCAMLRDSVNATRYGAVKKKDDYSINASEDEVQNAFGYHYSIGKRYLDEACALIGVKPCYRNNYFFQFV